MKKNVNEIIFFLMILLLLIVLSINSTAVNDNKVYVNASIADGQQLKVLDNAYYRINFVNRGDSFIQSDLDISLIKPSGKEIFVRSEVLRLEPYSSSSLFQNGSRSGEYSLLEIDEPRTYKLKINSSEYIEFYQCKGEIYNITADDSSNNTYFCKYNWNPKETKFDFEVLTPETKSLYDKFNQWISGSSQSTQEAIDIAKESKKLANWSFYLVLLTLLIAFFSEENILYKLLKGTFLYDDFLEFIHFLKKLFKPLIKRKRIVFYISILLVVYWFLSTKTEYDGLAFIVLVFWFFLMLFYFSIYPEYPEPKPIKKIILNLIGFGFLIYLSIKIVSLHFLEGEVYNEFATFTYFPIITHLLWLVSAYIRDKFR